MLKPNYQKLKKKNTGNVQLLKTHRCCTKKFKSVYPKILRIGRHMPKIPENSIKNQVERSILVSNDQNIRDHLWSWSDYFGWTRLTEMWEVRWPHG